LLCGALAYVLTITPAAVWPTQHANPTSDSAQQPVAPVSVLPERLLSACTGETGNWAKGPSKTSRMLVSADDAIAMSSSPSSAYYAANYYLPVSSAIQLQEMYQFSPFFFL
jgi:hypothetical protein